MFPGRISGRAKLLFAVDPFADGGESIGLTDLQVESAEIPMFGGVNIDGFAGAARKRHGRPIVALQQWRIGVTADRRDVEDRLAGRNWRRRPRFGLERLKHASA